MVQLAFRKSATQDQFTSLPMPVHVIHRVEYMAEKLGHIQELTFRDSNMNNIEDKIAPHQETLLIHKIENDIDEDNNDGQPPLVGHQGQDYDDEDDSSDSDDKSDDNDKDNYFYNGPDPGVSDEMLDTR